MIFHPSCIFIVASNFWFQQSFSIHFSSISQPIHPSLSYSPFLLIKFSFPQPIIPSLNYIPFLSIFYFYSPTNSSPSLATVLFYSFIFHFPTHSYPPLATVLFYSFFLLFPNPFIPSLGYSSFPSVCSSISHPIHPLPWLQSISIHFFFYFPSHSVPPLPFFILLSWSRSFKGSA